MSEHRTGPRRIGHKERLIAAAPKLLKACKGALRTLVIAECDHVNLGGSDSAEASFLRPAIRALRKAIAEAEGKDA